MISAVYLIKFDSAISFFIGEKVKKAQKSMIAV